jgi:hypothetical protein
MFGGNCAKLCTSFKMVAESVECGWCLHDRSQHSVIGVVDIGGVHILFEKRETLYRLSSVKENKKLRLSE